MRTSPTRAAQVAYFAHLLDDEHLDLDSVEVHDYVPTFTPSDEELERSGWAEFEV